MNYSKEITNKNNMIEKPKCLDCKGLYMNYDVSNYVKKAFYNKYKCKFCGIGFNELKIYQNGQYILKKLINK